MSTTVYYKKVTCNLLYAPSTAPSLLLYAVRCMDVQQILWDLMAVGLDSNLRHWEYKANMYCLSFKFSNYV